MPDPQNMTYDEISDRMDEVRSAVDDLMTEYFALHCMMSRFAGECIPDQVTMTEFLTICAWQSFNDSGQRGGDVRIILRDGSMPLYVARGMLSSAMEQINLVPTRCLCAVPEEDDDEG